MAGTEQQRAKEAARVAAKWRGEHGIYYGFVMIKSGRFFEFCEQLPETKWRKGYPIAVDINDNVFVLLECSSRWDTIFHRERKAPAQKESIIDIVKREMIFCFPSYRDAIENWFSGLKAKRGMLRRFETMPMTEIMRVILEGVDINRFLSARSAFK